MSAFNMASHRSLILRGQAVSRGAQRPLSLQRPQMRRASMVARAVFDHNKNGNKDVTDRVVSEQTCMSKRACM